MIGVPILRCGCNRIHLPPLIKGFRFRLHACRTSSYMTSRRCACPKDPGRVHGHARRSLKSDGWLFLHQLFQEETYYYSWIHSFFPDYKCLKLTEKMWIQISSWSNWWRKNQSEEPSEWRPWRAWQTLGSFG